MKPKAIHWVTDFSKYGEAGAQGRFRHKGREISKYFGGPRAAQEAYRWVLREKKKRGQTGLWRRERYRYRRKMNTLPIGVTVGNDKGGLFAAAYCSIEPGIQKRKVFYFKRFGKEEAIRAAMQWRRIAEEERRRKSFCPSVG